VVVDELCCVVCCCGFMNGDEWDGSRWFVLDCWIVGFWGGRKGVMRGGWMVRWMSGGVDEGDEG